MLLASGLLELARVQIRVVLAVLLAAKGSRICRVGQLVHRVQRADTGQTEVSRRWPMKRPNHINTALESATPPIVNYVAQMEAENLRLHKQIARLQVENVTKQHKLVALEAEIKNLTKKHGLNLNITFAGDKPATSGEAPAA